MAEKKADIGLIILIGLALWTWGRAEKPKPPEELPPGRAVKPAGRILKVVTY